MVLSLVLLGCIETNLVSPNAYEAQYNPPDLGVEQQVDNITQVTVPAVDVLWVIDNSGSMQEEQTLVRDNIDDFMRYFTDSGLDYHVGVVSTDMDNRSESGQLIQDDSGGDRFITSDYSAQDAIASFKERANLGIRGSSNECGRQAAYTALTEPLLNGVNKGFYREDAVISTIVISDERDWSRDPTRNEFQNWYNSLKAEDDQTWFSAIVGPDGGCSSRNGNAEEGTDYLRLVEGIGGIAYSICESDWSSVLEELGMQAAGLKREFFLSLVPVESTIKVTVETDGDEDKKDKDEWVYDPARNSITFNSFVPEPLAVVSISYDVLSSASTEGQLTDTAVVEE